MQKAKLTDEKCIEALNALAAAGGNETYAAAALGISRGGLQNRLSTARLRGLTATIAEAVPEQPAAAPIQVRLQDENARLRAELKAVHRDNLSAEEVREKILGLTAATPNPPTWMLPPLKPGHGITGVPVTIWSDWHLGEVVNLAETNGVNEFNLKIADVRIRRLVERTVDLCFNHMTSPSYPGIVVNILGDMVTGEIHEELAKTNDEDLLPTLLWARDRLIWALEQMAEAFGSVFVPTAFGNHGRMTRKPEAKRYVYKNFDWLLCCLLERHFQEIGDDRVQFQIPATGESLYSVYGHRYLGVHGDDLGVRGGDGIIGAIGPIMRGEIKMRHSQAQIDRDFDTLLMGHWHQTLWLPRAHVNNTLKGMDEYARRQLRAVSSPPAQSLWFTHPKRGITARWEVNLGDQKDAKGRDWVTWERPMDGARRAA